MWTTAQIKRHIANLKPGELFTTRNLLLYGKRGAIDQAVYVLVESDQILRLARGVFMKPALTKRVVTAFEIAQVKAAAFGKQLVSHAVDAATKLGLTEKGNEAPTYFVNGSSSSFRFGNIVIYLKRASMRKVILGDDKAGLAIKALWSLGKDALSKTSVMLATNEFGRQDRKKLHYIKDLMPAWLSDFLYIYTCSNDAKNKTGASRGFWANFWAGRPTCVTGYAQYSADIGLM